MDGLAVCVAAVMVMVIGGIGACKPTAAPETPTPPPVSDTDSCEQAERRLEELACLDRRGDPMWVNRNGERFADTCRTAQSEGGIFFNPRCVAAAQSCEEALACPAAE